MHVNGEPRSIETKGYEAPLVIDLFCGLGGWSEAFIAHGYRAVGFDVERHDYGSGGYPGELVLRDVRSLTGADIVTTYGIPAVIVASPPCQEFSYMAMPWTKAKEKMRKILADSQEQQRLTDLFNQCFRIQREVSEAAGRYVPMVVENVRGAQKWVGKARWNFGSFYLWGDVPALMPIPWKVRMKSAIVDVRHPGCTNYHQSEAKRKESLSLEERNRVLQKPTHDCLEARHATKGEGNKTVGMNWSDQSKRGQDFTRIAGMQADSFGWSKDTPLRNNNSKSLKRKQASAEIAKIPPALADWIARCFKPKEQDDRAEEEEDEAFGWD